MSYRLGVDVGGTFTDLLLINDSNGEIQTAKVLTTPEDPSIAVLNGLKKICDESNINSKEITRVMHGTTVATNAILTGNGAKVGLVTTQGYRQVLHIARSFVPGGLGGWVSFMKQEPLAPLELTVSAKERIAADGSVVEPLDENHIIPRLQYLRDEGIEALTICLINSFTNPAHEQRIKEIAEEIMPEVSISISTEVVPEMQEYERTETTVVNSFVKPVVETYVQNLQRELRKNSNDVELRILRSDGGLSSVENAVHTPVNMLLSGPAGGVAGALWYGKEAGYENLLTFDMGGTSTDVALIQNGVAQIRRETRVGHVSVRAPSIDVRSVGAGGGSIAFVPELTKALRVGPDSAGAVPGPAAYGQGGEKPTVTDANVVLGYLPASAKLGGDMNLNREKAEQAIQTIADALGMPLLETAEGIINIVNENMFGALRLVSVEQGFDSRDFALIAFGGAGPLHANALGSLMHSWPVIIPPGPGVLCAYGDATTKPRNEASRTFVTQFNNTSNDAVIRFLEELEETAVKALVSEGIPRGDQTTLFQVDVRYHGQGLLLNLDVDPAHFRETGLQTLKETFDKLHTQLFTFALEADHEFVNLRAIVQGPSALIKAEKFSQGRGSVDTAVIDSQHKIFVKGKQHTAPIYDRSKLAADHVVQGPAIIIEMDATVLIQPDHTGTVNEFGNIIINPQ